VEGGVPCGIITDRDIILRCVAEGGDPLLVTADAIMSRGVETIRSEDGVYEAAQKMRRAQVRRLAVVDESGNALGIVSFDDVFDLLSEELGSLREVLQGRRNQKLSAVA